MTASLALAAPGSPAVDVAARTIRGLAVPYGPVGQTSRGRLQFAAGSLSWSEPRRVKLLREHDQRDVVGYATQLDERPDGLHATFTVPAGAAGDAALAEARDGLRDAFSVGVQLDDATADRLNRAQGLSAVAGAGQLREVSLVSVPAFDDARVAASGAELVVSSWSSAATPDPTPTPTPTPTPEGAPIVTAPAQPAPVEPTPVPTDPAAPTQPAPTEPQPQQPAPNAPPIAVAGGAVVTGAPATYTFSGDGPSLARDAYAARFYGDSDAARRLSTYNTELQTGNAASVMALAAVLVRDDAVSAPFIPDNRRPDLFRQAVDRGRPLHARIDVVPIRNAQPFLIPNTVPEFDGVRDHVEGTAHVPEGTLTLSGERTLAPRAVSGAFRMSREMVDSSNPAIDRVALAAMLRDYRRQTETRLATALTAGLTPEYGVATVAGLRAELVDFTDDDTDSVVVLASKGMLQALALDVDADGRPMLAYVNPTNAPGTLRAGYTGASVDGTEVARATRLAANTALILDAAGVLVAESPTATFRFDEVEGPGIVKLALFGYHGAARLQDSSVRVLTTAPAAA